MRSALPRTAPLEAAISGIGRTRPKSVRTSFVRRASARIPSRQARTLGNWLKYESTYVFASEVETPSSLPSVNAAIP